MSTPTKARRAIRLSRPDQEKFFTVMVVFSHRTFRWSFPRKILFRGVGLVVGVWLLVMVGSAYGFWATKKIMSFPSLQQETKDQGKQLKQSLGRADELEAEVANLKAEFDNILKALTPKEPPPEAVPTKRGKRGRKEAGGKETKAPKEAAPPSGTRAPIRRHLATLCRRESGLCHHLFHRPFRSPTRQGQGRAGTRCGPGQDHTSEDGSCHRKMELHPFYLSDSWLSQLWVRTPDPPLLKGQ